MSRDAACGGRGGREVTLSGCVAWIGMACERGEARAEPGGKPGGRELALPPNLLHVRQVGELW